MLDRESLDIVDDLPQGDDDLPQGDEVIDDIDSDAGVALITSRRSHFAVMVVVNTFFLFVTYC